MDLDEKGEREREREREGGGGERAEREKRAREEGQREINNKLYSWSLLITVIQFQSSAGPV